MSAQNKKVVTIPENDFRSECPSCGSRIIVALHGYKDKDRYECQDCFCIIDVEIEEDYFDNDEPQKRYPNRRPSEQWN